MKIFKLLPIVALLGLSSCGNNKIKENVYTKDNLNYIIVSMNNDYAYSMEYFEEFVAVIREDENVVYSIKITYQQVRRSPFSTTYKGGNLSYRIDLK